ncbi:MAG: ABC transporter ATP-binding protein [Acidimicrobiales bacterium]
MTGWSVVTLGALGAASIIAGLAEASLLVLVVSVALEVTDAGTGRDVALPVLGSQDLAVATSLWLATALGLLTVIIHLGVAHATATLTAGAMRNARDGLISAFGRASWGKQAGEREGSLQEAVSTLSFQSAGLMTSLAQFVAAALTLAALIGMAMLVSWQAALVVIAFGIALSLALGPLARMQRRRAAASVDAQSGVAESVAEWSTLALEYRTFGVIESESVRLSRRNHDAAELMRRSRITRLLGGFLYRDVTILGLVAAIAALNQLSTSDIGEAGAVVLLVVRAVSSAQQANASAQAIREQSPSLDRLHEKIESLRSDEETTGSLCPDAMGQIALRDVSYSYDSRTVVLRDLDLQISRGEAIGVIGPSGAGKSTLVELLLRLRRPTEGEITVDGVEYTLIAESSWRHLVSFVPQTPRMFRGTVAENIAMHREGIDEAKIRDAAALAHVREEIEALPLGFDTVMGPRGAGLSGGQTQRIAIARALAGEPQLLILDEPTSALDPHSEAALTSTIGELKGRTTMVVVAHRVSTLGFCDRIVAMAGGKVLTVGTLAEAEQAVRRVASEPLEILGSDSPPLS